VISVGSRLHLPLMRDATLITTIGAFRPRRDCRAAHVGSGGVSETAELDPEDAKIITLARATRVRAGATEGAAVRDETGRTYAASTVELPSLSLSAVQLAVAMAVAGGAQRLEAAAVVTDSTEPADGDLAVVRDLGGDGTPLLLAGSDGKLRARFHTR